MVGVVMGRLPPSTRLECIAMKDKWIRSLMLLLTLTLAGTLVGTTPVWSDDDDDKARYEESENRKSGSRKWFVFKSNKSVGVVNNEAYKKECGACHFAYQPALLPSGSWKKIMGGLDDHFGDNAVLDAATAAAITDYLTKNAAEFSESKRAYKILRSLDGKEPLRITEVPSIQREHREISKKTLERKKITTLANCNVCHKRAERGLYGD